MPLKETHIALAHGNGGRYMRELIEDLFVSRLGNAALDTSLDAATVPAMPAGELVVTTDGFTVHPLEFPGGNIGSLAVHGTVNDLAVAGATPVYLTLNAFIEEGIEIALLERLIDAMAKAAADSRVNIIAGDTKVVRRGEADGVYFATTGLGIRPHTLRLAIRCWSAARLATTARPCFWRARSSVFTANSNPMPAACCISRKH